MPAIPGGGGVRVVTGTKILILANSESLKPEAKVCFRFQHVRHVTL